MSLVEVKTYRGRAAKKGPSPPKTAKFRLRKRRGGRQRRRKSHRQSGGIDAYTPVGKSVGMNFVTAPAAVSGQLPDVYYRSGLTAPVHKDWGVGNRSVGCSVLGTCNLTTGDFGVMNATVSRGDATLGDFWDLNYYYGVAAGLSATPADQICYSMHPAFISRVGVECEVWSRYVIRSMTLHFAPKCATTETNGVVAAFSRDISGAFDQISLPAFDLWAFNHSNIRAGALWQGFSMNTGDQKTDKTWSTNLPAIDPTGIVFTSPMQNRPVIADVAQDFYQFNLILYNGGGNGATGVGNRGWFFIEYIIDFYGTRLQPDIFMHDDVLPDATPPLRAGQQRQRPRHVSHLLKDMTHKLGVVKKIKPLQPEEDDKDSLPLSRPKLVRQQAIPPDYLHDSRLDSKFRSKPQSVQTRREAVLARTVGRSTSEERSELVADDQDCPCCGQLPCKMDRPSHKDA